MAREARDLSEKRAPRLQFTYGISGFTMKMTQAQEKELAKLQQVAFVWGPGTLQLHTDRGPKINGAATRARAVTTIQIKKTTRKNSVAR